MATLFQNDKIPSEIQALVTELINSREFQRLKKVSFLGAIERFGRNKRLAKSGGSRFEHSLGVAGLALALRDYFKLTPGEFRVAIVHALLHDVGHGPFSHSSERFFRTKFGIDHHQVLISFISDACAPLSTILRQYSLWNDYRRFLEQPSYIPAVDMMFHGPINVDTIEGILRAADFFGITPHVQIEAVLKSITRSTPTLKPLDSFWMLKDTVYNDYIFNKEGTACDELISQILFSIEDEVRPGDFYLDDEGFERRFGEAIGHQVCAIDTLTANTTAKRRIFEINHAATPKRVGKLGTRYSERRGADARERKRN